MMESIIKSLLAAIIASALAFSVGYYKGVEHQKDTDIISQVQSNKEAMIRYDRLYGELDAERKKTKIVYRTITQQIEKIVDRAIYRNDCFDSDGIRLYNDALNGSDSSSTSK